MFNSKEGEYIAHGWMVQSESMTYMFDSESGARIHFDKWCETRKDVKLLEIKARVVAVS